jgi:hypothetical protein
MGTMKRRARARRFPSHRKVAHTCGETMKPTLLCLLGLLAFTAPARGQDSAGVFFYGPAPTVDAIQRLAPEATTSIERDEGTTRLTVSWPEVSIVINIDPNWPRDLQLAGIRGLLAGFSAREKKKPAVVDFLERLERTTTCYGVVIEPAYDREGKALGLMKRLLAPTGGFLFTYQSFYDADGRRITGLQDDPERLE